MNAADKEYQRGVAMMKASTPNGYTWPRDEVEWNKAVAALEQMGYATYLKMGMPEKKARALARITHGGARGRQLLEISQQADRDSHG